MPTKTKYQSGIVAGGNFHLDIGHFNKLKSVSNIIKQFV